MGQGRTGLLRIKEVVPRLVSIPLHVNMDGYTFCRRNRSVAKGQKSTRRRMLMVRNSVSAYLQFVELESLLLDSGTSCLGVFYY